MNFYKKIFTNIEGKQTSQIFAVTHSPFIIHNEFRENDKVIVLSRDENGEIKALDRIEYYKCDCLEAVQDAFSMNFSSDKSIVYLEGRTDEKYFKKAVKVFEFGELPFEFRWVGHIGDNGQEENSGKDALNKAIHFLINRNLSSKNICLFDSDAKKENKDCENNVYIRSISEYENSKNISEGIENALILDEIDIEPYYVSKPSKIRYGKEGTIIDFDKMTFCDAICAMDKERLRMVFQNLKTEIDKLIDIFKN